MASIFSHPAVPIAFSLALGRKAVPLKLTLTAGLCSILPDIDVVGFHVDVPYGDIMGHRGFTHSLLFAAIVGLAGACCASKLGASRRLCLVVLFICTASHGVLDAMTDGGLGVAFFSPFSNHRYFFPWQVLEVSPIDAGAFFSARGLEILSSEFRLVWAPLMALGVLGLAGREFRA